MKTLDSLLDMIGENISYWYPITLKSKRGKKLTFSLLSCGEVFHAKCEKPGKRTHDRFIDLDEAGRWKQYFASEFKLKLNAPCWTIHEDTIKGVNCAINELQCMKDFWENLDKEDEEKPKKGDEQMVLDCCKE